MKNFSSVNEALDFAISNEECAATFYTRLAAKMDRPAMRKVFEEFAAEELGHKAKLVKVKEGKLLLSAEKKVTDLRIGDYLDDAGEITGDIDYQQALTLAMKREKAAFKLYSNLAASTDDSGLKGTFLALAQEEAKHKLRFEIEYDENILSEN